jgi:broad specificity phosphatase PhoE
MSALFLVRHARASAFTPLDYDQLSEPGLAQARLLGAFWADRRLAFDAVYVGPRRRHLQTHDLVRAEYERRGLAWPEPVLVPELDEHEGIVLLFKLLPTLAADDDVIRRVADGMTRGEQPSPADVLSVFKRVTRRWARGELGHAEVESWAAFRARVRAAVARLTSGVGRGRSLVAFTSAGPVAAAVGAALEIGDEKVLDLSWSLHNASFSELAFSEGRMGLRTFNATPHIGDPELITSV